MTYECEECGASVKEEGDLCQKCCDHTDVDKRTCLICGKDLTEDLAAEAEWRRDQHEGR